MDYSKLYELITVIIRQAALIGGTWLVARGDMEKSMLEPIIGLSLNTFSIAWMAYVRFVSPTTTVTTVVVQAVTPTANT